MAHATSRGAYQRLTDRLNRFPQGAPPSELLYRILQMLFSEREAGLVAQLPIRPFGAKKAAQIWGMSEAEAHVVLDAAWSTRSHPDGRLLRVLDDARPRRHRPEAAERAVLPVRHG